MGQTTDAALAALLQLGKQARQADSITGLGFVVVNESRQLLDYRQSLICYLDGQLASISGLPEPERNTPYSLWLKQVAPFWKAQKSAFVADSRELPKALAAEWQQWLPAQLLVVPLKQADKPVFALWLLARDQAWQPVEVTMAQELAACYAHAWQGLQPRPGLLRRLLHGWQQRKYKKRILLLILLIACLPVHLTVLAPAEVVAKQPFLVRAPLQGVIDQFLVQPNTPVKAEQPLFELDTTGIRMQLDVARQAHAAAIEEYRQAAQLALGDNAQSKLELARRKALMEEKAAELEYSEQLLDRVQVKSPKAGIAIFSDSNDWLGKNVSIGEKILQIADPQQVEINIQLPVGDAIPLSPDAEVTLYLTTAPQYTYAANLSYSAYRAEIDNNDRVSYKLKAQFASDNKLPRIGLTGTAKIYGDKVPLIYYVMRRPLAALRQMSGW